jgi:hypothetical protein
MMPSLQYWSLYGLSAQYSVLSAQCSAFTSFTTLRSLPAARLALPPAGDTQVVTGMMIITTQSYLQAFQGAARYFPSCD